MTKNNDTKLAFHTGRAGDELHDILWASMTEKTMVEARARKISGCSRLRWVVGAERCVFLSYTHARGCEALGSN